MKRKVLKMEWYDAFSCVGGVCPMTCCSTKWTIALSDSEIEHYKQLDHPFRDRILEAIDLEKKQMKDKDGYCPLMTKDGWCSLVQECGAEHLGFVCSDFPREHHTFGDVTEGTIGIACPVAAGYLFKSGHIEFDSGEMEDESEPEPIDYQLYDNLAALRAYLVELVQSYDGNFVSGKLYVIFRVMEKTEEIWKNGALNRETAEALIEAYRNEEILAKAFWEGEQVAQSYANRARLLQKLIRSENPLIRLLLAEPSCEKVLTLWREDLADLEQSVEGFLTYFREHYLCMAENYLVYTLFQTWIRLKPEDFGKDFMIKMAEFLTFQLLAMAVWREQGK